MDMQRWATPEDDPLAAGNVIWKPKYHWAEMAAAMMPVDPQIDQSLQTIGEST